MQKSCLQIPVKKMRIFETGSRAVKQLFNISDIYICPICLGQFDYQALESCELTLEHAPPRSQGGKGIILTCKKCNNVSGYTMDAALSKRDEAQLFADTIMHEAEQNGGRGFITINDERMAINVSNDGKARRLKICGKRNNPASISAALRYLKEHNENSINIDAPSLTITIQSAARYRSRLADLSDLRSAYLLCTAAFGFSFALCEGLSTVRRQIAAPDEFLLDSWHLQSHDFHHFPSIILSKEFGVLFVSFCQRIVYLPWPSTDKKRMSEFEAMARDGPGLEIKGRLMPWPNTLVAELDFYRRSSETTSKSE